MLHLGLELGYQRSAASGQNPGSGLRVWASLASVAFNRFYVVSRALDYRGSAAALAQKCYASSARVL